MHEMIKLWGRVRFYNSCNYSCTMSFMVKILLLKQKNLNIQYDRISTMKKHNSNQNVRVKRCSCFSKRLTITIRSIFWRLFELSSKTVK